VFSKHDLRQIVHPFGHNGIILEGIRCRPVANHELIGILPNTSTLQHASGICIFCDKRIGLVILVSPVGPTVKLYRPVRSHPYRGGLILPCVATLWHPRCSKRCGHTYRVADVRRVVWLFSAPP
jgi:hypothetical protein